MLTHKDLINQLDYNPLTGIFIWKSKKPKSTVKIGSIAGEQCVNWSGCDSTSPAYKYVKKNTQKEIKNGIIS